MIVSEPRLEVDAGMASLRARFEFDEPGRPPFEARLAVSESFADVVDTGSSPFVPLATQVAGRLGEDVHLEAPASPRLVRGAEAAGRMFAEWWGYRPPRIDAPAPSPAEAPGEAAVGMFFTRGVDTGATLVRSLEGMIPERVTHLISGFDIEWGYSPEAQMRIWEENESVARELGLPLVRLESNAKDLVRGIIGWPRVFGVAYLSPALMLGPGLGHIITGATQPVAAPEARGSRWDLDPLWSTERTSVRQDAFELSRLQRLRLVAREPLLVRTLKVCWEGRDASNCGRCGKCLRVMTALATHGVDRSDWPRFDGDLTVEAVRASRLEPYIANQVGWTQNLPDEFAGVRAAWADKQAEAAKLEERLKRERVAKRRRRRLRRLGRRTRRRVRGAAALVGQSLRGRGRAGE